MYLFLSDLHLGRGKTAYTKEVEQEAVACLTHFAGDLKGVYLLGDIFEQFIEHRHYVPKGFVRLIGTLANLVDAGVPVTYALGNHDPWHADYFEQEVGVRLVRDQSLDVLEDRRVFFTHGDGKGTSHRNYRMIQRIARHPASLAAYRLLPADSGYWLAGKVARFLHGDGVNEDTVIELQNYARLQAEKLAADLVVMGHSHAHELVSTEKYTYLNTGFWYQRRTFGILNGTRVTLMEWKNQQPNRLNSALIR